MTLRLTEKDLLELSLDPLKLFYISIKSPQTQRQYERYLRDFLCNVLADVLEGTFEERAKQFLHIAKTNPEKLSKIMHAYAALLKKKTQLPKTDPNHIGTSALKGRFKPIRKFLEMNDVLFNWKRLRSTFPESRYENQEIRGYTREEIQTMIKHSRGAIDNTIILVASSSGIRAGAFDFKWGDITPVYKIEDRLTLDVTESEAKRAQVACAIIVVYKGNIKDEYPAFITPEAHSALMEYRKIWAQEKMREPKDSDYVFMRVGIKNMPLSTQAITARISRLVRRAAVRNILETKRHNVPIMHGFRKFFNKTIKNTPSDSPFIGQYILKERMMGHSALVELDKNYYKEHILEKAEEYIKSVPHLTISDEERMRLEKQNLEKENSDLVDKTAEIPKMKKQIEHDHLVVQVLAKTMKEIGINFEYPDGTPYEIDENLKIPEEYLPKEAKLDERLSIANLTSDLKKVVANF